MKKKFWKISTGLLLTFSSILPSNMAVAFAQTSEKTVVVDDTQTDANQDHYFAFSQATDANGALGWAADTKVAITDVEGNSAEAQTQHWVWNENYDEAKKHVYQFTFKGTGAELIGVKNDEKNTFQLDTEEPQDVSILGEQNKTTSLYKRTDLSYGQHTIYVTLPVGTGLQVSYAKVFGVPTDEEDNLVKTTIPVTKTEGTANKFTFSETGWSSYGQDSTHVWSDKPTADEIWYEVSFVGKKIDVYAGKNHPMGMVEYFIDGKSKGEYSLYNASNISSTLITSFTMDTDGVHTFKAVSTGKKASGSSNSMIDASKIDVYHAPYEISKIALKETSTTLVEGAKYQIECTYEPDYAELNDIKYTSLDSNIATVSEQGEVEAISEGTVKIQVEVPSANITFLFDVTVQAPTPQMQGSIVSTDLHYTQASYDTIKAMGTMSQEVSAWQSDKALSKIAVISKDSKLSNVHVTASDFSDGKNTIAKENVKLDFIKTTKAYNGPFLGYGSMDRPIPEATKENRSESPDILNGDDPVDMSFNSVQPIWVEIAVPKGTPAGTYTGSIDVKADGIEMPLTFTYTLHVQGVELPDPTTYANTFDIELWQYPYSSAEYYDVEPFSQEHLDILRSSMELYKGVGGHAITTSVIEDAWAGQTYSKKDVHYPSMVKWTKQADGSFSYDYSDFDAWVSFNKSLGMGDKIVIYSIAPWNNAFTYYENGQLVKQPFNINNAADQKIWKEFLQNLIDHLMEKGWFDESYIGIDERGFSKAAFDLVDSVRNIHDEPLKTAGAMDAFVNKWDLGMRVTDLNVGDTAAAAHPEKFKELVAAREALGYRTTLYSCTEHRPGNFALSAPVESYWSIINAGASGTVGFLRWAYDAWVEDPLRDITHNSFEPGDTALIYPDEKNATNPISKSSVRLEQMASGVRDVNKIMMMVKEIPSLQADADAIYAYMDFKAYTNRNSYLSDAEITKLATGATAFRKGLAELTEKYIRLKETGTDTIDSVEITEKDQEITIGNTLQLHAKVLPENALNSSIIWSSSNDTIVSVQKNGQIIGNKVGVATIHATSQQDPSKAASIKITVKNTEIEESAQVAYYSFDTLQETKEIKDAWGTRNGINNGTYAEGKSGNALKVTEAGKGGVLNGTSGIKDEDAWTIGYWVKTDADFTNQIAVISDADANYAAALKMAANRDSGFRVGKKDGDVLTFAYGFQPNTWYHVAWTQSKTDGLSMYVNGTLIGNNAWSKTNTIKFPMDLIGSTGFTGLIDEVKVYNKVLNVAEVKSAMQTKGLNLTENYKRIYIDDTYTIETNLYSDQEDKTIIFSSNQPDVASVDASGVVTGHKRGSASITVSNPAGGYVDTVTIDVEKHLNIANKLPEYTLPEEHLSDVEKAPNTDRQYLGQPDMIKTASGRLITAYPMGHGEGPIIMRISDDNGTTWVENTNTPKSWAGSQETPTLYALPMADGSERLMMITACPGWGTDSDGNSTGWNTSYSDDDGITWTEYAHWYSEIKQTPNKSIVGMASLIQLKDADGNFIQKWMGVYHNYDYKNYKTYLTFDENGNEQWSEPTPYLSEYRDIESSRQMCEIGMFRSPDGNRIIGLARSQSHNHPATLIYSDDEGETWSKPMDLPGSLAGERHKATYDPISGRLVITFREIIYDLDKNNEFNGGNDWMAGDWVAWVGTYEDLMEQNEGQYRIRIAEDFTQNAKSGDTGYAGVVVLADGTFLMDSYGHWDQEFSQNWSGGVTTDLCYIKQAKFKLGEIDNLAGLIDRSALQEQIAIAKTIQEEASYEKESWNTFQEAFENAKRIDQDSSSAQSEITAATEQLKDAISGLTKALSINISQNIEEAGTVSGEGYYQPNDMVTLQAEAVEGYEFVEWRSGSISISKLPVYSFTIRTSLNIQAVFKKVDEIIPPIDPELPITIEDETTGVEVHAEVGVLPKDTKLVIDSFTQEMITHETHALLERVLGADAVYTAFDISLSLHGENIQPNGMVTISLKIPEGYRSDQLAIYYIDNNGIKTELAYRMEGDYIIFETNHFSLYVLQEKSKQEDNKQEENNDKGNDADHTSQKESDTNQATNGKMDTNGVQTGDHTNLFSFSLLLVLSASGLLLLRKYKKA